MGPDRKWNLTKSAGGLVSALLGIHSSYETTWVGWPGVFADPGPERDALTEALKEHNCAPVYLDEDVVELYYNGYCNNVLWPLFHYVPLPLEARLAETKNLQTQWSAYCDANQQFAQCVIEHYEPGDIVWCHDYHVLLLPRILKEQIPSMKVGWFLHTPFPSSEIYRALPRREEILRGVLKSDLIGFHTYDYARHFVSACTRILGLEGTPEGVEDAGTVTRVAAFPIGIDPEIFTSALETDVVKSHIAQLKQTFNGRKVMLGVDRLDMIKGIPQKLLAFEMFLDEHPEWREKVILVQIAVPSRTHVPEYQRLASLVHEMVGRINGRFGTVGSVPIHHLDRSLSFLELCALYALTDVALVTPVRDGMNLVSYEVVACQSKNAGVLVLSEFAGAAQSLGAGAVLVNPWNVSDLSSAIEEALTMSDTERRERHRQNFMHVTIHTAQQWADTFVSELNDTHVEAALRTMRTPPQLQSREIVNAFHQSKQRLIILGYNATLTTAVEAPRRPKRHFDQIKALTRVNPKALASLQKLAEDPDTMVIIFSGSARDRLEGAFGDLPIWLAAENGVFIRPPPNPEERYSEWTKTKDFSNLDWIESVQLVFDYFCERTPRSFVETRETSLVWNYKYADPEFGRIQARDLLQHLVTGPISSAPVDVIQGSKSVEVRPVGVSKGMAMDRMLTLAAQQRANGTEEVPLVDFVMCIGHFLGRDEDIFTYFEEAVQRDLTRERYGECADDNEPTYSGRYQRRQRRASGGSGGNEDEVSRHAASPFGTTPPERESGLRGRDTRKPAHDVSSPTSDERTSSGGYRRMASHSRQNSRRSMNSEVARYREGRALLQIKHLFTTTVGRKKSQARFFVQEAQNVADLVKDLADPNFPGRSFESDREGEEGVMPSPGSDADLDSRTKEERRKWLRIMARSGVDIEQDCYERVNVGESSA
eukprot:gene752-1225_t